jgi:hypothetical protein
MGYSIGLEPISSRLTIWGFAIKLRTPRKRVTDE